MESVRDILSRIPAYVVPSYLNYSANPAHFGLFWHQAPLCEPLNTLIEIQLRDVGTEEYEEPEQAAA